MAKLTPGQEKQINENWSKIKTLHRSAAVSDERLAEFLEFSINYEVHLYQITALPDGIAMQLFEELLELLAVPEELLEGEDLKVLQDNKVAWKTKFEEELKKVNTDKNRNEIYTQENTDLLSDDDVAKLLNNQVGDSSTLTVLKSRPFSLTEASSDVEREIHHLLLQQDKDIFLPIVHDRHWFYLLRTKGNWSIHDSQPYDCNNPTARQKSIRSESIQFLSKFIDLEPESVAYQSSGLQPNTDHTSCGTHVVNAWRNLAIPDYRGQTHSQTLHELQCMKEANGRNIYNRAVLPTSEAGLSSGTGQGIPSNVRTASTHLQTKLPGLSALSYPTSGTNQVSPVIVQPTATNLPTELLQTSVLSSPSLGTDSSGASLSAQSISTTSPGNSFPSTLETPRKAINSTPAEQLENDIFKQRFLEQAAIYKKIAQKHAELDHTERDYTENEYKKALSEHSVFDSRLTEEIRLFMQKNPGELLPEAVKTDLKMLRFYAAKKLLKEGVSDNPQYVEELERFYSAAIAIRLSKKSAHEQHDELLKAAHQHMHHHRDAGIRFVADVFLVLSCLVIIGIAIGISNLKYGSFFYSAQDTDRERVFKAMVKESVEENQPILTPPAA